MEPLDDIEEVRKRFDAVFDVLKPKLKGFEKYDETGDYDKLPYLYPGYRKAIELYDAIKPHAFYNYFPRKFFHKRAPNEKPDEFEYRKELYKTMGSPTRPFWGKALFQLNRIWNNKNYTLSFTDMEDKAFSNFPPQEYFFYKYPGYESIEAYFRSVVTTEKINDPNALLCIRPREIKEQNEMLEPVAVINHCQDVLAYEENEYALVRSMEKSTVLVGGKKVKEGLVFFMYDTTAIWKIYQVGEKRDYAFEVEEYYRHELDYLPCFKLKGIPHTVEQELYYESYFGPALPAFNDALSDSSTLRMSKISHAFLQRWEYAPDCDEPGCESGYIGFGEERRVCGTCKGTGKRTYLSPLQVMQVNPPTGNQAGENSRDMVLPPFGYDTSLDPTILTFLSEEIEKNIASGLEMLNMAVSHSSPKGSDTALGKQIDRESLFTFLLNISNELFELYENTIETIGKMRYGEAWKGVEINYPQTFTIRTEAELTGEITEARKNFLPDPVQKQLVLNYINTRFNSDADQEKVYELMVYADPLFNYNAAELTGAKATGLFKDWELYMHNHIGALVMELTQDTGFFDKAYLEQQEALYALAKEKYTAENPGTTGAGIVERTTEDIRIEE